MRRQRLFSSMIGASLLQNGIFLRQHALHQKPLRPVLTVAGGEREHLVAELREEVAAVVAVYAVGEGIEVGGELLGVIEVIAQEKVVARVRIGGENLILIDLLGRVDVDALVLLEKRCVGEVVELGEHGL